MVVIMESCYKEATSGVKFPLTASAAVGVVRAPEMSWQHGAVVEDLHSHW
jgi:hypothetical protein